MQISQMMRSMLGETRSTDAKTLEVKPGQVVRGTVVQWLSTQDAVVQIEGVQVKARLEAALARGQSALLQVMADSVDGALTLKLLTVMEGNSAATLDNLLLKLGMKPNDTLREIALALRQAGLEVTKEQLQALRSMMDASPPSISRTDWLQTGVLALTKGLPLEPQPLAALARAVFGPPVGQSLAQLADVVRAALANPTSAMTQHTAGLLQELAARLQTLLQSVPGWTGGEQSAQQTAGGSTSSVVSQAMNTASATPAAPTPSSGLAAPAQQVPSSSAAQIGSGAAGTVLASTQASAASRSLDPSGGSSAPQLSTTSPSSAATGQAAILRAMPEPMPNSVVSGAIVSEATQVASKQVQANTVNPSINQEGTRAMQGTHLNEPVPTTAGSSSIQASVMEQGWLPRLLKLFGFDHEHQAIRLIQATAQDGAPMQAVQTHGQSDGMNSVRGHELASLKSALLQLAAADDLPLTLREPIQQLLQQVAGQQLLLTPDRTGNFAHVTLFVPFFDKDGQQTAAIHIQSRKSRKGGIDAENCRLWFDLRMAELGPTLVDVQVIDKRVNIGLFNNHPAAAEVVEQGKAVLAIALAEAGFHLLSLHQAPYPNADESQHSATNEEQDKMQQLLERNKPYKGVDYRI